jgi:hypothetical protein
VTDTGILTPKEEKFAQTPSKRKREQLRREAADAKVNEALVPEAVEEAPAKDVPQETPPQKPEPAERRYPPPGPLTWVECDLPGFEGISVGYDLGQRWDVAHGAVRDDDGLGMLRRIMVLTPAFRNEGLYDPLTEELMELPTYGELQSYRSFFRRVRGLPDWILAAGFLLAKEESVKNFGARSQKP